MPFANVCSTTRLSKETGSANPKTEEKNTNPAA
jgi:hypothetical protein